MPRVRLPVVLVAFAACAAEPTQEQITARMQRTREIERVREVDAGFAAAGRALVDGFPLAIADASFWPGDRLLFGVESFDGPQVERFFLLFETVGRETRRGEVELKLEDKNGAIAQRRQLPTGFCPVRVTLFDAERRELRSATSEVAREVHEIGVFPYALASLDRRKLRTLVTARTRRPLILFDAEWGRGIDGLLLAELTHNAAMADLAGRLSISPSWFEAFGFLGETLRLYFGINFAKVVPQPIAGLPAGEEALECPTSLFRQHPFLVVNVVHVPAVGPLAMSAGIVTLTGYRAEEPDRRFVVRLLGLARGTEPAK